MTKTLKKLWAERQTKKENFIMQELSALIIHLWAKSQKNLQNKVKI